MPHQIDFPIKSFKISMFADKLKKTEDPALRSSVFIYYNWIKSNYLLNNFRNRSI